MSDGLHWLVIEVERKIFDLVRYLSMDEQQRPLQLAVFTFGEIKDSSDMLERFQSICAVRLSLDTDGQELKRIAALNTMMTFWSAQLGMPREQLLSFSL